MIHANLGTIAVMTRFFYATLLVAAATAGCPSRELPPPAESAPAPPPAPAISAGR